MNDEEFKKMLEEAMRRGELLDLWDVLNKQLGYDKAFQTETDDVIALDFRAIDAPSFMTWTEKNLRFSDRPFQDNCASYKNFAFFWHLSNIEWHVFFIIIFWENCTIARSNFRTGIEAKTSSLMEYEAWRPCKNSIGTACARTSTSAMFVYKNAVVSVEAIPIFPVDHPLHGSISGWSDEALVPKSPNGEPWDMVFAEWVFDILKSAPRFKEFPSEPQPRDRK